MGSINKDMQIPYLRAAGVLSEDGRKFRIAIINKHPERGFAVPIQVRGFTPEESGWLYQINADELGANNEPEENPEAEVKIVKSL